MLKTVLPQTILKPYGIKISPEAFTIKLILILHRQANPYDKRWKNGKKRLKFREKYDKAPVQSSWTTVPEKYNTGTMLHSKQHKGLIRTFVVFF